MTFKDAFKTCCKIGMHLLSVETKSEMDCLKKGQIIQILIHEVWTSASDEGSENNWMWCSSRKMLARNAPWDEDYPLNSEDHNCAVMDSELLLRDEICDSFKLFICEAAVKEGELRGCTKPVCLPCSNQATMQENLRHLRISSDATVMDLPDGFNIWGSACGTTYIQSNYEVDYFTAFRKCCELGLQLLSLESEQELVCLSSIDVEGNNTWTSGSNMLCRDTWQWCGTDVTFKMDEKSKMWSDDLLGSAATNVDNCAFLTFDDLKLVDDNCDVPCAITCEAPSDLIKFKRTSLCNSTQAPTPEVPQKTTLKPAIATQMKARLTPPPTTPKAPSYLITKILQSKVPITTPPTKFNFIKTTRKLSKQKRATKFTLPIKKPVWTSLQTKSLTLKMSTKPFTISTVTVKKPSTKAASKATVPAVITSTASAEPLCTETTVKKKTASTQRPPRPTQAEDYEDDDYYVFRPTTKKNSSATTKTEATTAKTDAKKVAAPKKSGTTEYSEYYQ